MPNFRTAVVSSVLSERPGIQRVAVTFTDGEKSRAYCLTQLTGEVAPGDAVVCNTTAMDLGLGTGGWHIVHWNCSADAVSVPGPDHIMKLRYTSLQADVGTSELVYPDTPMTLDGRPVVVCHLHSQMGMVALALQAIDPSLRVAYVMTDGAALPLALSDMVVQLEERGALHATVTAGHAFGGEYEAVTVASGMCLAVHVAHADIVVVSMGPGIVGTGTALGTTSIEVASVLDTVERLGGRAVWCVRCSEGDGRQRHVGVSHHCETVAGLLNTAPVVAPVPPEAAELRNVISRDVIVPDSAAILATAGMRITTMGRDITEDRLFFDACSAAAAAAAALHGDGSASN
jgi:hypothetical protein